MRRVQVAVTSVALLLGAVYAWGADDTIATLVQDLSDKDPSACLKAVDALGELGAEAKEAVPALIETLRHADTSVRGHAARTLGAIGSDASPAVAGLTKLLADDNSAVRAYAAFALGRIGKAAMPAADALIKTAFDKDLTVRRSALRALRILDPPQEKTLPLVLDILEQGDMSIIGPALQSVAEQGKEAVPRLRKALQNPKARYWACIALAEIGPDAADAVPELLPVLKAEDPDTRLQALLALGDIGEGSVAAVPAIVAAFQEDKFPHVRYAAVYALGKIGGKGPAQDVLQQSVQSEDQLLRTIGAWALAHTNPDDKQLVTRAVRMIVDAFKSDDVHVRRAAARAVVESEIDPEIIGPVLVDALKDKDPTVVANAVEALASFGAKALKHVDRSLENKDLRRYSLRLIGRLGAEAESAVPALVRALNQAPQSDEDVEFLREAQFAVAAIGPGASAAVPALMKSLSSDRDEIRASAAYALGRIGAGARPAVPALRESLKSESAMVKLASVCALLEIQPQEPRLAIIAAPLLSKAMDNENALVRAEAATAIGKLGDLGKRAIPRLKELLKDDQELVRRAAQEALKKLGD